MFFKYEIISCSKKNVSYFKDFFCFLAVVQYIALITLAFSDYGKIITANDSVLTKLFKFLDYFSP